MRAVSVALLVVAAVACVSLASAHASASFSSASHSEAACNQAPLSSARVGQKAPCFCGAKARFANGTIGTVSLKEARKNNRWVQLFFFPLAFTFVCPSELLELSAHAKELDELGVEVLAISVDSVYALDAWARQAPKDGGIGRVSYTLVSDIKKDIARAYGILITEGADEGIAQRGSFLIDPAGILRQATINDLPVGRNIDELVRTARAFQFADKSGHVCPSKWAGPDSLDITPDPEKKKAFFEKAYPTDL